MLEIFNAFSGPQSVYKSENSYQDDARTISGPFGTLLTILGLCLAKFWIFFNQVESEQQKLRPLATAVYDRPPDRYPVWNDKLMTSE